MLFKRVLCIILSFFISSIVFAGNDILVLKNGTRLYGKVLIQNSKLGVTFECQYADVVIPQSDVENKKISINPNVGYSLLSNDWKQCFSKLGINLSDDNYCYGSVNIGNWKDNNSKGDELYKDLLCQFGTVVFDAILLQDGASVRFVDKTNRTLYVAWELIASKEVESDNPMNLNGLIDVVTTKDNQVYRGFIKSQTIGASITIKEPGYIDQIINFKDILSIKKIRKNENSDLFEQFQYLDEIVCYDGVSCGTGVIVLQSYEENPYVVFCNENGERRIWRNEIAEIKTFENPKYNPNTDVDLVDNLLLFNRTDTLCWEDLANITEFKPLSDDQFNLTVSASTLGNNFYFEFSEYGRELGHDRIFLMSLDKAKFKIGKKYKICKLFDPMSIRIPVNYRVSSYGTARFEFDELKPGRYALFFPSINKLVSIHVI